MKLVCPWVQTLLAVCLLVGCARPKPAEEGPVTESENPYQKPLVSPGAQFAALPPAVQNVVRAETGSADIANIITQTNAGVTTYTIYFENKEMYPPLEISQNGQILNTNSSVAKGAPQESSGVLTGGASATTKPSELPLNVKKAVQERVPGAEIAEVTPQTWGNRTVYIVALKGGRKLYVAEDGIVLNDTH